MIKSIKSLKDLQMFAEQFSKNLSKQSLVLLEGPLGVGKTQLVRFMAEELGASSKEICSPSFSLLNLYKTSQGMLAHADFFRLEGGKDLESIAFWDTFDQAELIFVEWPDKKDSKDQAIVSQWPQNWKCLKIKMKFGEDSSRLIEWETLN